MLPPVGRAFNVAGPCRPDIHYMIDPLRRVAGLTELIDGQNYFVLHAPRQVGKTTSLEALAKKLTAEGRYAATVVSCEAAAITPEDVGATENVLLAHWRREARDSLPIELGPPSWPPEEEGARIGAALGTWAEKCPRPLVLFIDEIDSLTGRSLLSVLRQLRLGHRYRPDRFPWSIGLAGMRDVRDYKIASGGSPNLGTSSPFNIKVESLTLRNFDRDEVAELYDQHTADTGQRFDASAAEYAFELTQGQPWLVNALAREATLTLVRDRSLPITRDVIDEARERLILRQDTHLDSLAERLREDRVQRVIEPILAGHDAPAVAPDDLRFVLDLGLVRRGEGGAFRIANPIYQEVIPRVLAAGPQSYLPSIAPAWLTKEGRLDADALLGAFLAFWRQHGEPLMKAAPYHEIAPHLVLMAFLHRVVNGEGRLVREYATGSGRMDLYLEYGRREPRDRLAIELKVWREGEPDPAAQGLEQLDPYLAGLGLDRGWLVIFDRRPGLPRLSARTVAESTRTNSGRSVRLVRA
jgi:hypothetical protein